MIDVMTDAYLIEAQLNVMKGEGKDVSELQVLRPTAIEKMTKSIFELNLKYYTYHPEILERVMDSVTNRFAKAQQ